MSPYILTWTGKAVSANRRLKPGKTRWIANKKYKEFKESMAWAFKPQCKEKYIRMGLKIDFNVGANMDHHNLLKPICDAIELAGIIDNDKHIDDKIIMMPPTRHKRGQPDQITVEIIGGWPAGKSKEENK